jgi:hypothetical protein
MSNVLERLAKMNYKAINYVVFIETSDGIEADGFYRLDHARTQANYYNSDVFDRWGRVTNNA